MFAVALTGQDPLRCIHCHKINLHHDRVEIWSRDSESSSSGLHVDTEHGDITIDRSMLRNPSPRRGGILIEFSCENCRGSTELAIYQHKGCTYLELRPVPAYKFADG